MIELCPERDSEWQGGYESLPALRVYWRGALLKERRGTFTREELQAFVESVVLP